MLNTIKQTSAVILASLMLLVGCKKEDKTFGDLTPPEKPVITVDVVGKTPTRPAGDGSGSVNFTIVSKNAINYTIDFGNGSVSKTTTSNVLSTSYSHVGVRTITVTAIVSGVGGLSSSVTATFDVRKDYTPPAELVTFLTNDASKTWKVDSVAFGHLGVGPGGAFLPIWWEAPANDKVGLGIYDDEFTFTKTGNVFAHKTNGTIFGKREYLTDFNPALTGPPGDFTLTGPTAANYSEGFSYDGVGSTEFIQFATKGHMGLYVGAQRFQILARSSTKMFLRCIGKDGNSWYVRIKAI